MKKDFQNFMFTNTELCIDLKLVTRQPGRMAAGKCLDGKLTRDADNHYTFIEGLPSTNGKRNPHVFIGKYITITRRDDGSLRPNFKPVVMGDDFSTYNYARDVANELLWGLSGLVGEEAAK